MAGLLPRLRLPPRIRSLHLRTAIFICIIVVYSVQTFVQIDPLSTQVSVFAREESNILWGYKAHQQQDLLITPEDTRRNTTKIVEASRVSKLVTVRTGKDQSLHDRVLKLHDEHDKNFGYTTHVLRESTADPTWSWATFVMKVLLEELAKTKSERVQWLLSMDASVVPLNTKVPIEAFLPPDPEGRNIQALVTSDDKGLQSGIFALRVSRWSVELMSTLISSARYSSRRGPKNLDKNRSVQEARPATLEKLVEDRTGFGLNVSVIPQRWIGASPTNENITQTLRPWHVRPGDFAVNTNQRGIHEENMLRDWVEIAEAHASKWTVDLQKTVYLTEPRQWWEKELKSRRRYST